MADRRVHATLARMNLASRIVCLVVPIMLASVPALADEPPAAGDGEATPPVPATPTANDDHDRAPATAPPSPPSPPPREVNTFTNGAISSESIHVSARSIAGDYDVMPAGYDLGGNVRAVTADGGLGTGKLKLTDVALFDAHAEWALHERYELDLSASVLAKQPSTTHEAVFQGGSLTVRRALPKRTSLAIEASGSPLVALAGFAAGGQLFVTHKHRLNEVVSFALAGGANAVMIHATHAIDTPYVVEGAVHASVLVRAPEAWGGWLGVGYALPAVHHGHDPASGMTLDPQPRLEIDLGNGVQLSDDWDLTAVLTIRDRGDLANPATRLPILDGGFDQIQAIVGVSRRFHPAAHHRNRLDEPLIQLY
jgi:hypothetical protein